MHEHGFNWLLVVPGLEHAPVHVLTAFFVAGLLIACCFVARTQLARVMQSPGQGIIPDSRLSFRNFFEILAEKLYAFVESVLGERNAPIYFPLIGTLFLFIFSCNLIGLVPGFLPPTDNLNTTLALGTFVFVVYNFLGFKEHGIGYVKHFFGPVWWLAPLIFIIEVVSHLVRPLSLGLRLRGNILGDHMVLGIFLEMTKIGIPVVFYCLGIFVSFVQAFVFCLLTMIYISLAVSHEH